MTTWGQVLEAGVPNAFRGLGSRVCFCGLGFRVVDLWDATVIGARQPEHFEFPFFLNLEV